MLQIEPGTFYALSHGAMSPPLIEIWHLQLKFRRANSRLWAAAASTGNTDFQYAHIYTQTEGEGSGIKRPLFSFSKKTGLTKQLP